MPSPNYTSAAQAALAGGPKAVFKFMKQEGHPKSGAWCGEFAAAVFHHAGLRIPNNPEVASNWRNIGQEHRTPQEGDVAVRRYMSNRGGREVPTGSEGSHVTFVGGTAGPGQFTAIGGNQGNFEPHSYPTNAYQFYGPPSMENSTMPPISAQSPGYEAPVAPTAYQANDGTYTGGGPSSNMSMPPLFNDAPNELWNAPINPAMSLDGEIPEASREIPGAPLPTEPFDYSGNQYIDQMNANGSPALPDSLSLSPLVNSQGQYQSQPAPSPFESPSPTPSETSSTSSPGDSSVPDSSVTGPYLAALDGMSLPESNLSARPLDSWTQAAFHPSNSWGSGGPTQRGVGAIVGTAANLVFPGSGFVLGPLARLVTRAIQGGVGGGGGSHASRPAAAAAASPTLSSPPPSSGSWNPFGGLPTGFTELGSRENPGQFQNTPHGQAPEDPYSPGGYSQFIGGAPTNVLPGELGPQFNSDSIFGGHTNLAMALPGSFTGLGQGSDGTIGWNYFADQSGRRLWNGGDPTLGFGRPGDAITQYAAMLHNPGASAAIGAPIVNWGFPGGGGTASRFGPNGRQMNQV